jgi:small subunit ribosomal protein S21
MMTFVIQTENETFDSLLKRFRKKVNRDRIKTELRKRRFFVTKGERDRIARRKGIQRARRRQRRARRG